MFDRSEHDDALLQSIKVARPRATKAKAKAKAKETMLVRGLQARHARDHELLAAALPLFDAVHAALKVSA